MGVRTALARCLFAASVCLAGVGAARAAARSQDGVLWVHELDSDPTLIGREIVVEGRFSTRVGRDLDQLKLHTAKEGWNVEFHLSTDVARDFPSPKRFVRVAGKLTESGGKLVLRVNRVTMISATDADRFQDVARHIAARDHRAWTALADRTEGLAQFYGGDKELLGLARDARVRAFQARELSLQPPQVDELLALANEAKSVGLGDVEAPRLRYKALRWRFDELAAKPAAAAEWSRLADQAANFLPGAKKPLPPDAARDAAAAPARIEEYESQQAVREAFDRDLWAAAMARAVLAKAADPSADLFALANEAKETLTDRPAVWKQVLGQAIRKETRRLAQMDVGQVSARQVRGLAETLRRDLDRRAEAERLLRDWLDRRRAKLARPEGRRDAEGRLELARDYRADLGDDVAATQILLEAVAIDSTLTAAVDELKKLGLVKGPNGWVRSDDPAAPDLADNASRSKLPAVGMTPDQVRKLLGEPKPEDIVRVATRSGVIEQWVYALPSSAIYVTFRIGGSAASTVVAVNTKSRL